MDLSLVIPFILIEGFIFGPPIFAARSFYLEFGFKRRMGKDEIVHLVASAIVSNLLMLFMALDPENNTRKVVCMGIIVLMLSWVTFYYDSSKEDDAKPLREKRRAESVLLAITGGRISLLLTTVRSVRLDRVGTPLTRHGDEKPFP